MFLFFIGSILALAKVSPAQTPIDSLIGVNSRYAYVREDLALFLTDTTTKVIGIGGSFTKSWKLQDAKFYWDKSNPDNYGYYILKLPKKLKVGVKIIMYVRVDSKTWIPDAIVKGGYDIFPDEYIEWNDDHSGRNFVTKVNDFMSFSFDE